MNSYIKILIPIVFLLASCEQFDYSQYQVLSSDYSDINQKNINRFINIEKDTVTLAVIGDTQRFYNSTRSTIAKINATPDIDFVVHSGDLVDFGTQDEFEWMHELLSTMNYPYVAVVGNHDLIGNGDEIYRMMYGPDNFSFTFNRNKFIYLNTVSSEDNNVPDVAWIEHELSDTSNYDHAIIVSHVSNLHGDFNSEKKAWFEDALRKYEKVMLSISGHNHQFSFWTPEPDGISYMTTSSTTFEKFVLVKIWESGFSYEIIE